MTKRKQRRRFEISTSDDLKLAIVNKQGIITRWDDWKGTGFISLEHAQSIMKINNLDNKDYKIIEILGQLTTKISFR